MSVLLCTPADGATHFACPHCSNFKNGVGYTTLTRLVWYRLTWLTHLVNNPQDVSGMQTVWLPSQPGCLMSLPQHCCHVTG